MITVHLEGFEEDVFVAPLMREQIELLEPYDKTSIPMWFHDREKDKAAVEHLVHCMKVVHDYFSMPTEQKYFDYENTSNS